MSTSTRQQGTLNRIKNSCIAITGGVATGKSMVASMLRKIGYPVIDADQLARNVVERGQDALQKIEMEFGPTVLDESGNLDRSKIRDIVMKHEPARKKLETIMHPAIQRAFEDAVEKLDLGHGKIFFYEASLIFELGRENFFKECWATYCSEETQIKRLQKRSNLTQTQCLDIIRSQMPAAQKAKKADVQINTETDIAKLEEQIKNLVEARNP